MSNFNSNPQGCPECGGAVITTTRWIHDAGSIDVENCYCEPTSQEQEFGAYLLNVGRDHFAVCAKHNAFRRAGSNLFSNWREMTDADFQENAKALLGMKPLGAEEAKWQYQAEVLFKSIARGCSLCSKGDIHKGSGCFWNDDHWICETCWQGLVKYFREAGPRA